MIALDTCLLIDLDKQNDAAAMTLAKHTQNDEPIMIASLSFHEYLVGLNEKDRVRSINNMKQLFTILEYDSEAALVSSELDSNDRLRGLPRSIGDLIISSTLKRHGIKRVITRDKGGFDYVDGLEVITY
jgi:predicted nucleic acid-binding protein